MKKFNFLSHHIWRRFWSITLPYWQENEKWKARGLVVLLIGLLLAQTQFAVLLNHQTGEFTSAMAAGERERFWDAIKYSLVLLAMAVPVHAFFYFVRDTLGNHWRRWLTTRFLKNYFAERHFYALSANNAIDNPDQRIAEDINTFTARSLYFLLIFIGSLMQLVAFSHVLWSISHKLVYFLVIYAVVGTLVTIVFFGTPLMKLNFFQLRREADFRFSLVRVRENAESIAFYRGEEQEFDYAKSRFGAAFDNYRRLIRKQLNLNLFQQAYTLFTIVLPSIIVADAVLSGELEIGKAIQAAGAFAAVLSAMSLIVDNFESLSRFTAGIERLDTLARFLLDRPPIAGDDKTRPQTPASLIASREGTHLAIDRVTLHTPKFERTLVRDLSLEMAPGDGLLIVGDSGCGKSSLLRAIAGLWRSGSGEISRPPAGDTLFLPQKPYMQIGSLRSQLLYPHGERTVSDDELQQALRDVHLPDLIERVGGLDSVMDWEKVLSMGEQQRLAFARVLITRPRFAILDEATSALDSANEAALYQRLKASGTTLISIAHRAAVLKYHDKVLELTGGGGWALHPAAGFVFK